MIRPLHRVVGSVLAAIVLAALAGCNTQSSLDMTEAEVVVTINNQPLPNAQVSLFPSDAKAGPNAIAIGVTDATGRAKLSIGAKPGACVGPNKVTITEAPPPAEARSDDPDEAQRKNAAYAAGLKNRPIPAKYATVAQSDSSIDVKKDQKEYKIDLKR
jgi:hypothetical protein